jgi:hypothetical protein
MVRRSRSGPRALMKRLNQRTAALWSRFMREGYKTVDLQAFSGLRLEIWLVT